MGDKPQAVVMETGDTGNAGRRFSRKTLVIAAVAAAVVLGSGGGAWYWVAGRHGAGGDQAAQRAKSSQQLGGQALQQAIDQAYAKKDYAGAAKLIQQQSAAASDPGLQIQLATADLNNHDYQGALAVFAKLDKAGQLSSGYADTAGDTAVQAGDKQLAIHYYQLAKERVKAEQSPRASSYIAQYDKKIADLQK